MSGREPGALHAPLLETKLHAPRRRRGIVPRPRLDGRLRGDELPALTLVSAAAGFGKTTLLAEWVAAADDAGLATAWLSLDARDNDPVVFWSYVVAALRTAAPEVGGTAQALLHSSQAPMDAVVTTLLNDLEGLADETLLVLDDYHVVESQDLHEAMVFFVEHLPPHVHLVVGSRADPPLPLGRLRASGDLLEVRAADLRFTPDEAATYLNGTMGLGLTSDDVLALEARTEGWIAALQLAALSMQGRDDVSAFVAGFAGDDRFIVDYLVDEVLRRQSDETRSFLLHSSILSRLTAPLCAAVTGQRDAKARLDALERANLFLVALDDRRLWYRYHHLFADVLRARLLDEQPGLVPVLHRRACDWYDADGDRPEAIRHAMAAGDVGRAAELIELAVPTIRATRQEATLRAWLGALPRELFADRPVLSIGLVGSRMATGDVDGVAELLDGVEAWLDPRPADETAGARSRADMVVVDHDELRRLPGQVAIYRAGLALMAGDLDGTVAHADRAFELAIGDEETRGAAAALVGLARWAVGDLDAARSRYTAAVASFTSIGFVPDVLGCSLGLADILIAQGRLGDAARTYEDGLALARGRVGVRGTADMHVGLAEVLRERNELDAALAHLDASRELGQHAGLPQHRYRWRVATALVRRAQGDVGGALELLDEAERVYDTDYSPPVRPVSAVRARVQLAAGDVASVLRWAADRGLTADDELTYVREYEHVTLARALLASEAASRHAGGSAMRLLDRLLAAADDGGRTGTAVEVLALQALAHQAGNDTRSAVRALRQALERAAPEGYARVFLDEGPPMVALLRTASRQGVAVPHLRRLLAAVDDGPRVPGGRSGLVDELSSRELEVLALLRSDLSGPDIARELMVSLNTMRTHTKNIFTKLGVNNRREAVRRAAELGL